MRQTNQFATKMACYGTQGSGGTRLKHIYKGSGESSAVETLPLSPQYRQKQKNEIRKKCTGSELRIGSRA